MQKLNNKFLYLSLVISSLVISLVVGCGQTTKEEAAYTNQIPFPTKDVVFQLDDLNVSASSVSSLLSLVPRNRAEELVTNAYAQAGIDLGYFEGFDPVLSTFRSQTLTTIATNEFTFTATYGGTIPFKGHINYLTTEAKYIVKVWGIRPGEASYRRWLYGDLINTTKGTIIIDPYIMWTSTHSYPMSIKFSYDATDATTKVCTGGATGKWSASSEIIGSSYFYCKEDNTDPNNTIVTFQMYQERTNEVTGASILDKLYGKFNRDTKRLYGRNWNNGYPSENPDSGLLYVSVEAYTTIEGEVPSNLNVSSMDFPATPEADFAAWPATSEFPAEPDF